MFDVGFWEVTIIAVVALLVVGPERLPGLARTVGQYVGKMRRYADHIRREIEKEVPTHEIRQMVNAPAESLTEVKDAVQETKDSLADTRNLLDETEKELNAAADKPDTTGNEPDIADDEITEETKQKFAEAGKAILEQTAAAPAVPEPSPDDDAKPAASTASSAGSGT